MAHLKNSHFALDIGFYSKWLRHRATEFFSCHEIDVNDEFPHLRIAALLHHKCDMEDK
ncbi:hypothetical protein FORC36_1335 [Vibrio vulnificus]|nr:hypothetical protein FORC17_1608 [Vibrio vulnificus]ARN65852.1 hypothetical protein FORC36_1335 [Vibrio vulnificus]QBH27272.1 Hypothetical protein FORC77_1549 [Vibrio vulnificus]